jgi:hypothetical protein
MLGTLLKYRKAGIYLQGTGHDTVVLICREGLGKLISWCKASRLSQWLPIGW